MAEDTIELGDIYQVHGENIEPKPRTLFDSNKVYLIVDKKLRLIWIWAGCQSRLFHRYIASSWAGKLKNRKKFYNFKYEVIKEGSEPEEFRQSLAKMADGKNLYNKIKENNGKQVSIEKSLEPSQINKIDLLNDSRIVLTKNACAKIINLVHDINEINKHMTYLSKQVDRKIHIIKTLMGE
ncbi:MAG: hypothetical protein ACFFCS_15895 [Candidatus Hodarchaeota archaeon]